MAGSDEQGTVSRRPRPTMLKIAGTAGVFTALGLGFLSLATVGTDRWIETSYNEARSAAAAPNTTTPNTTSDAGFMMSPAVTVTGEASVAELPSKLVVGDEQQWLSAPAMATEKVVATSPGTGGLNLGDRLVLSVGAKGAVAPLARTFEVVGIEALTAPVGETAVKRLPHVLIAREVDTSGKPMTLRLLVSESDEPLPTPQKTL